jgi:DNA-binding response OmpR family regulator
MRGAGDGVVKAMGHKILVIEDSVDIADLVALHLGDLGCDVKVAGDGLSGLQLARAGGYDLIVLDLMLPGLEGLEVCRRLRGEVDYTPILMLTAKSSEIDRVLGLEIGADDYLTKPFSIRELVARVKAILRRTEMLAKDQPKEDPRVVVGDMTIDVARRGVSVAGHPVELTAKEFDLLVQFARNPGRVYTRQHLLDLVWGRGHLGYEHTVNSHINRLRSKIEADPANPRFVLTVWGVGYKFNDRLAA